ncbi:MAG: DUF4349 domain-containing protein [Spirochaetes bacterium]|nr:DUF4349 domain-containing protein [Spirochaetota bacterium]
MHNPESIGKIVSKTVHVDDVIKHYYDLETDMKTKRIHLNRYQAYLQKASSTDELLKLERTINDVTGEIAKLESDFRDLKNLISYSTLDII